MKIRIEPTALDDARVRHGLTSDEQLGHRMQMTGTAIRNLRHGRTCPSVETLVKLSNLSGRPMDRLVTVEEQSPAA